MTSTARPSFIHEEDETHLITCGIDEAGRAPLAGPVTAACVFAPLPIRGESFWLKVKDSKKLSNKLKDELFDLIKGHCFYGVGEASPEEIDDINIHHATLLAMKRAYIAMTNQMAHENYDHPTCALVDGKFAPELDCSAKTIIKGDNISSSIAAASILAKVTRDRYMAALHEKYPYYGWNTNAGYPTPAHKNALKEFGVTEHHRRSFAPVRDSLTALQSLSATYT
jgi:ribonuclease HII